MDNFVDGNKEEPSRRGWIIATIVVIFFTLLFGVVLSKNWLTVKPDTGKIDLNDKLREKILGNPELKKAVDQMADALREAMDNPAEAARIDVDLESGMSCVIARGLDAGLSFEDSVALLSDVRNAVIVTEEQQLKYIKFNARISGTMRQAQAPNVSSCR